MSNDNFRHVWNKIKRLPYGGRIEFPNLGEAQRFARKFHSFRNRERKNQSDNLSYPQDPYLEEFQTRVTPHESNPTRDPSKKFWTYIEPLDFQLHKLKVEPAPEPTMPKIEEIQPPAKLFDDLG